VAPRGSVQPQGSRGGVLTGRRQRPHRAGRIATPLPPPSPCALFTSRKGRRVLQVLPCGLRMGASGRIVWSWVGRNLRAGHGPSVYSSRGDTFFLKNRSFTFPLQHGQKKNLLFYAQFSCRIIHQTITDYTHTAHVTRYEKESRTPQKKLTMNESMVWCPPTRRRGRRRLSALTSTAPARRPSWVGLS
jgi:hypothetical protein